jgi:hypothetical protein
MAPGCREGCGMPLATAAGVRQPEVPSQRWRWRTCPTCLPPPPPTPIPFLLAAGSPAPPSSTSLPMAPFGSSSCRGRPYWRHPRAPCRAASHLCMKSDLQRRCTAWPCPRPGQPAPAQTRRTISEARLHPLRILQLSWQAQQEVAGDRRRRVSDWCTAAQAAWPRCR